MTSQLRPNIYRVFLRFDSFGNERRVLLPRICLDNDVVYVRDDRPHACKYRTMCKWLFYDEYKAGKQWREHERVCIPIERHVGSTQPNIYWENVLLGPIEGGAEVELWVKCDSDYAKEMFSFMNSEWHSVAEVYCSGRATLEYCVRFSDQTCHSVNIDADLFVGDDEIKAELDHLCEELKMPHVSCVVIIPEWVYGNPNPTDGFVEWLRGFDNFSELYSKIFVESCVFMEKNVAAVAYFIEMLPENMKDLEDNFKRSCFASYMYMKKSPTDKRLRACEKTLTHRTYSFALDCLNEIESIDWTPTAPLRWKFNYELILDACIALSNACLPVYVLLEIFDHIESVSFQNRVRKVRLIEGFYASVRKLRVDRQRRENGSVALRTRRAYLLDSIKDPDV